MFATACMCSIADQAVSVLDDLSVILVEKQHLVVLNSLIIGNPIHRTTWNLVDGLT